MGSQASSDAPRDFEIMLSIRIVYDPNEFFVETYFVFLVSLLAT